MSSNYYAAVILAMRDSARALQALARASREAANASHVLACNARLVAEGRLTPAAAAIGDHIAHANKAKAVAAVMRAQKRYARAQEILASHRPLTPDDIAARVASYPAPRS